MAGLIKDHMEKSGVRFVMQAIPKEIVKTDEGG
jgi:hypothetical protein